MLFLLLCHWCPHFDTMQHRVPPFVGCYIVLSLSFCCEDLKFRLPSSEMANHPGADKLLIRDKLLGSETQVTALSSSVTTGSPPSFISRHYRTAGCKYLHDREHRKTCV